MIPNHYVLIIYPILTLFFTSCKNRGSESSVTLNDNSETKTDRHSFLIGKSCAIIDNLLIDDISDKELTFLLYTGFDCNNCIKEGFKVFSDLKNRDEKNDMDYFVISIHSNTSSDQIQYKYYGYIHIDINDIIRKELKYIPTPVIIQLDSLRVIKNIKYFSIE